MRSTDSSGDKPPQWSLTRRDFLRLSAVAGAAAGAFGAVEIVQATAGSGMRFGAGKTVGTIERIPSMCQACTTACGIVGNVKDGRLLTVVGNPEDPNSRGSVCAKGVAGPSLLYDPYRPLFPLRRVGRRGEGRWKRISWEEAYTEIADKLRVIRENGHPEEFAFQQGRNRSKDITDRFLDAYGTPSRFNHRALCSANRRAAILTAVGETDWDLGDYENSRYVLNFGSNWAEAHQGHIPIAIRMMRARELKKAKIVTFDARLSNTAALSDEWFCVKPGTDGLVALAMSNVICTEGLWDKEWFDTWCNYPADEYAEHVRRYTPELAQEESGVPATTIRRIAREFAAAAPRCTTISNRGSHAHWNGFYNDRAITLLNALVGNMGKRGGWCWHPVGSWDKDQFPVPAPVPPKPTVHSVIADAKRWPLANAWDGKKMRVGEIVYLWIKEGRQKISALMTYNCDQAWAWPEANLVREVLSDEKLIPFHFCLDARYSETAHLADIVLPWTTYLERWDIDGRPPLGLVDYVGLRQPVVAPLGECKDTRDIFPELARRIGGGMGQYFPWKSTTAYLEDYFKPVPGGLAYMREHGAWQDPDKRPYYEPYERELTSKELAGTFTDPDSKIIYRGGPKAKDRTAVGVRINGIPRRGFVTPSRKVEVFSDFVVDQGKAVGTPISPLPVYEPTPTLRRDLGDDELIMISFKWNVHTAHRTQQSKWLQEIVHSNPAWINARTARRLGLDEGDWIEVTSFRPIDPQVPHGDGSPLGTLTTRVHVTEGVHPSVIAVSHNCGRWQGGPIATNGTAGDIPANSHVRDPDATRVWWAGDLSVPQNNIVPIYPDPRSGQQAFHDTHVRVRKL